MTITMRFKIEYSKTKTDRWGHILPSVVQDVYADSLEKAKAWAEKLSAKYRKYDVNVFDTEGPEFREETLWCVYGFKAGSCVFTNNDYFKAVENPAILDDYYLMF